MNKRWLGAGGEKLDRQGLQPEFPLRGLKPEEDPLPRILEQLEKKPEPKIEAKALMHARRGRPGDFRHAKEPRERDIA